MEEHYRQSLNHLLEAHRLASKVVEEETEALQKAKDRLSAVEEAQSLVQQLVEGVQAQCHKQIAAIVERCLQAIFGEEAYEFKIVFEKKRARTEASPVFYRKGHELSDPLNEIGGGVIDVAAFALRLSELLLSNPRRRRLLVLDEPFLHLHGAESRERVRQMLEELSKELGIQLLILTQDDTDLCVGKVVELG